MVSSRPMSGVILGTVAGGVLCAGGAFATTVLLRYLGEREERWLATRRDSGSATADLTAVQVIGPWLLRLMTNALVWGALGIGYFVAALAATRWLGGILGFDPKMPFVIASIGPVIGFLLAKTIVNRGRD